MSEIKSTQDKINRRLNTAGAKQVNMKTQQQKLSNRKQKTFKENEKASGISGTLVW